MVGNDTMMKLREENARLRQQINEKGMGGEQAATITQEPAGSGTQSNGNGGGDQDLQVLEMSLKISQLESELDEARREKGDSGWTFVFSVDANKLVSAPEVIAMRFFVADSGALTALRAQLHTISDERDNALGRLAAADKHAQVTDAALTAAEARATTAERAAREHAEAMQIVEHDLVQAREARVKTEALVER